MVPGGTHRLRSAVTADQLIGDSGTRREVVSLAIGGMTCGACAARIERRLNRLEGVNAAVNYATERARVVVSGEVTAQLLLDEVAAAGYSAELARDLAPSSGQSLDADQRVRYLGRRLVVAAVLFVPLMDVSAPLSLEPSLRFPYWQWVIVALAAPVVTWAAWPFHLAAARNARHGTSTMDTLISIGVVAATGWSLYSIFGHDLGGKAVSFSAMFFQQAGGAIYLDVAAGVTMFQLAGRYYEARSKRRTGNVLRALATVAAKDVSVLDAEGVEHRLPVALLQPGDEFVVRPGETIATDGKVVLGHSSIDRSAMTGESLPGEVAPGDAVLGGTVLVSGRLVVSATRVGDETQLAQMVRLVEDAQNEKASVQRLADRISAVFVPAVVVISLATLGGWLLSGAANEHAFSAALAVLIIACPCALGLATPTALLVASGEGARQGIFFKGYQALELSRQVDTVVLDKTGTVTEGNMALAAFEAADGFERTEILRLAGALEQASEHLVARALVTAARVELAELPGVDRFEALPGLGARGIVEGRQVSVGRADMFLGAFAPIPPRLAALSASWEACGWTAVLVGCDEAVVGVAAVADTVRASSAEAVARLRALGLHVVLLTGDNESTARTVAATIGVDDVVAGALPTEKVAVLRRLQAEGHSVAMVGDGVNDGPALACADLGLAVGSGTDVAINAADLIIVRDDLLVVPAAIVLARRTLQTIRGNLAWAFAYNVAAIPLAASGYLNPLVAGGAMALSSAFVVWNSSRLGRHNAPSARRSGQPADGLDADGGNRPSLALGHVRD